MDYDDNLVANYTARQARIRQIQDLLTNAVVGEDPPDDGIAEPDMVLTVRYDDTGEIETFLLGVRGVEDADIDVYSMQSPLGSAIVGARPGEQRTYSIPSGANLPVTLLKAVPYGMHAPKSARRQSVATATHQRPSATRGHTDWQRPDTQAHSDGLASRPLRYLDRRPRWTTTCGPASSPAHARCAIGRGERCAVKTEGTSTEVSQLVKGTDMPTTPRVWISPQAHERLHRELDTLRFLFSAGIADGDTDENAAAVRRAWEVRIQQIHDLLINAVVGEDPPNDGIAEPGMVVTIRYDATGDTDTFLLGVHGAEYADMAVYSIQSPLGAAIAGARAGERRTYHLPNGYRALAVTLLESSALRPSHR